MSYKRIVVKGGKKYTYYYHSFRVGDKVKKIYIGTKDDYDKWLKKREDKEIQHGKKSRTTSFNRKWLIIPGIFFLISILHCSSPSTLTLLRPKQQGIHQLVGTVCVEIVISVGRHTACTPRVPVCLGSRGKTYAETAIGGTAIIPLVAFIIWAIIRLSVRRFAI
jgi:hypothetical protein